MTLPCPASDSYCKKYLSCYYAKYCLRKENLLLLVLGLEVFIKVKKEYEKRVYR